MKKRVLFLALFMFLIVGCQREQEEYVSLRKQRLEAEAKAQEAENQAQEEPTQEGEEAPNPEENPEENQEANQEENQEADGEEENQAPKGRIIRGVVNLRKDPSTQSAILDKVENGAEVAILSEVEIRDVVWLLVETQGQTGRPMEGYVQKVSVEEE